MKIKTKRYKDRDVFHRDPNVNGVVELLLTDKTITFDEVINLVNSTFTYYDYEQKINLIKNCLFDDPSALGMFDKYCIFLENIYKKDGTCGNLRGALLEKFVYKTLEYKHDIISSTHDESQILKTNCQILIEEWTSKKTVDVFYYSHNKIKGESFECKIQPNEIDKDHIENLNGIYDQSECAIDPSIACFTTREAIEQDLKDKELSIGAINLLGFQELKLLILPCRQLITVDST